MKLSVFLVGAILLGGLRAPPLGALDPAATLPQLLHRQWSADDGLPHDSVRSLAQSPDGFLWVGTQSGLARFDGIGFETVLESEQVESLAFDRQGILWIGTYGGGLLRHEGGRLRHFGREDGLTVQEILELAVDPLGDLWIGTNGGGVLRFAGGRLEPVLPAARLLDPVVTGLVFGSRGELYVVSQSGVQLYQGGRLETLPLPAGLAPTRFRGAARRAAGGLWLATDGGLLAWDGFRMADPFAGAGPRRLLSVQEDRDGNVFLGGYDGILRRGPEGGLTRFAAPHPESDSVVWRLLEDADGTLWIGTLGGGLRHLAGNELRTWGVEEGLPSGLVTSVHEDAAGRLLLTTRNAGLAIFDGQGFAAVEHLPDEDLWAAYTDPASGDLYLGTSGAGLLRRHGHAWERWGQAEGLGRGAVFAVKATRDGTVWAATNGGLSRLQNGEIRNFTTADGLAANEVRALAEDRQGRLWVGTNGGLSLLQPDGRFRSFGAADLFPEAGVVAILEDAASGALWLGTLGGGLLRFRPADGELRRLQAGDGLRSDDIGFLVEDVTGHFWLGTSAGLVRVAKAELEARLADPGVPLHSWLFDRRHGLRGTVWTQSAGACQTRDGRLFFATRGGLVEVDPRRLAVRPAPRVTAHAEPQQPLPWRFEAPLSLPASQLEFHFSAPFQHVPEAFRLRYRLQGFDRDWRLAKTERKRIYRAVPPGHYSFEIQASDEEGRFSGSPLSLPVKVEARLAGPLLFAGAALGLFAGGIFLYQKLRLRMIVRRERELERQVERALAELKILRGMLPICSLCKKIRDDEGYWEDLDAFVAAHSGVSLTASFCPDCDRRQRDQRASSEKVARLVRAVPGGSA